MRRRGLRGPGWPSFAAGDGCLSDGQADPGKRAARWVGTRSRRLLSRCPLQRKRRLAATLRGG